MRSFKLILGLVALSALILTPTSSYAQETVRQPKLLIGVVGGYNLVGYSSSVFGAPGAIPGSESIENGSGTAEFMGLSTEVPLFSQNQLFLTAELAYGNYSTPFRSIAYTYFKPGEYSIDNLTANVDYALLNIGVKYDLFSDPKYPSGIGIHASASLGKTIKSSFTNTISETKDASGRELLAKPESTTSSIDAINAFRFALRFELTYDIPMFEGWVFTPNVGYDAPLTKVDNSNRNWAIRSLYFGAALQYCVF